MNPATGMISMGFLAWAVATALLQQEHEGSFLDAYGRHSLLLLNHNIEAKVPHPNFCYQSMSGPTPLKSTMSSLSAPPIINVRPSGFPGDNNLVVPQGKPRTRWQNIEAWTMTALIIGPIIFATLWLWIAPTELKCDHPKVVSITIACVTVTLCFWMPVMVDFYFGIIRMAPSMYDRRRDFATFVFAMVVGTGISYGLTVSCRSERGFQ